MKHLLITLCIATYSVAGLQGQGTINFSNDPVSDAPEFGGGLLAGTNFFAQLYAAAGTGAAPGSLLPVGSPMSFLSGVNAGHVSWSNPVTVPILAGGPATLQLRAWWSGGTEIMSYEAALASSDPNSRAGASPILNLVAVGNPIPPGPPASANFQSFALTVVPEPSALALMLCGGAAGILLCRPNRKH